MSEQPIEAEEQTLPDTKLCPFCAEPINQEAKKCIHCGEYLEKDRLGFGRKTFWDLLSLLIVPFSLLILGSIFAFYQSNFEQEKEATRAALEDEREATRAALASELEVNRAAAAAELQGTTEANRANANLLEQYLNDMSQVFLKENLEDENVRAIVRARSLAVINDLDSDRNAILIQFLREADVGVGSWLFYRADLAEAELERIYLGWADLSGADLSGARLSGADLSRTNLTWTNLSHANLSGADLSQSDIRWSDLSHANLTGASLSGANVAYSNLNQTDLAGADLFVADLTRSTLMGTNLVDADLAGAMFDEASYDRATLWPEGFDPVAVGAILEE